MSHWAELDSENKVIRILVGDNNDPAGDEGYQWLVDNLGGTWVKTSYNGNIRKNYAGVGYYFSEELDAFIAPKPFDSWFLNEETCRWEAPVAHPEDGGIYSWNEEEGQWNKYDSTS
jgi:hypothetical protein